MRQQRKRQERDYPPKARAWQNPWPLRGSRLRFVDGAVHEEGIDDFGIQINPKPVTHCKQNELADKPTAECLLIRIRDFVTTFHRNAAA